MANDWNQTDRDDADFDDESDDVETLACPACGEQIYEDAQQCPHCGDWIIPVDARGRSLRLIWIVAALLLIVAMIFLALR